MSERTVMPVDLVFTGDFELDAAAVEVWPHVLNYPQWQNFPVAEHVSGERGQEGEVVRLKKETDGYTIGPYYARTLKLEPGSRVIWKVYTDPADSVEGVGNAADVVGIVEFRVADTNNDRSRFSYNLIYEYLVESTDQAELDAFREQQKKDWGAMIEHNWDNLRRLVETGATVHA